jgi:hypothetical protein
MLLQGLIRGDLMRVNEFDFYKADEDIQINIEDNREVLEDQFHQDHDSFFMEEQRKVI